MPLKLSEISRAIRQWLSPASANAKRLDPKVRCHSCNGNYTIGKTVNCNKLHITTYTHSWCPQHELDLNQEKQNK